MTVATHQQPGSAGAAQPARTTHGPIVTGEAVPLDIRVARLGSRALALLVDLLVQAVLYLLLIVLGLLGLGLLASFGAADLALVEALWIVIGVLVLIGYPTATLTLTRGRTVGKLAVGLRVVRDDGGPIGFRHALTRTLVGVAVEFPALIIPFGGWILSMVSMMASRVSKRLGDHAAGTFVIHERNLEAWGWVPAMPMGMGPWAATLDLAGLDDELALAVRHYLARNRRLREPARTQLGQQLAREVAQATSPPPPAGTPGWAYLAAVHAERHARALRRLAAVRGRANAVWPELVAATQPPQLAATPPPHPMATPPPHPMATPPPYLAAPPQSPYAAGQDPAARWTAR